MSAASHNQEPLDVLIQRITNPLNQSYDPQLVYTFCERVKQQEDGPVAATRLLAYRVQSPQEREAMLALDLLDTCARTAGPSFQAELGKFRFLNELIKLLSPRYLGSRTPQRVKQRVVDLLAVWSQQMPHEVKIQEAFTLLQKQGLLDANGIAPRQTGGAAPRTEAELTVAESAAAADVALDPHRPPTPPLPPTGRPQNPIFEDSQKAALLKRLLQSTNPEDIQAANRLIKTMVKQDEERSERVSRRVTELETVHSNLRLLQEMMDSYSPETTSRDELELMSELCTSCQQLRGRLDTLAAEADDQDSALADLVSASEQIGSTLARHKDLLSSGGSAPLTLLQLESPPLEQRPPPGDAGQETSQEMLQKQLERLGLADSAPAAPQTTLGSTGAPSITPTAAPSILPTGAPPTVPPADLLGQPTGAPPAAVPGSGLADLLGSLGSPAPVPAQAQGRPAAAGVGVAHQPRTRQPAQPPARSAFDDLNDLVRLSMTSSTIPAPVATPAPAPTQPDMLSSGPLSSLSANQSAASASSPRPPARPTNRTPPPSPGRAAGAEPNGRHPIADLLSDDVSLLSTLSGPSSHDSLLSETEAPGGHDPAGGQPGSGRGHDPAAGDAVTRPPSLAEITVPLEEITPGGGAPLSLFSESGSLEVSLHPAGNRPRRDVTVAVITALNHTGRPVSQYTLQAVCDKTARVRLLTPSSADLPAGSPFLPPPAVSQVMLLARRDSKMSVHLRFMLSYSVDGDSITEMAEATLPGQS